MKMKFRISLSYLLFLCLFVSISIFAKNIKNSNIGRTYPDGHGKRIFFPFGDISFADKVIDFRKGSPASNPKDSNPEETLGIPDYNKDKDSNFATLGNGGELIVKFTDNVLYDIYGYDLFIFEVGTHESMDIFISKNGKKWISVGKFGGGITQIDISKFVKKTDVFRYVKLVDLNSEPSGKWPGADIDAIGAIGSTINFQLKGSVLFETGEAKLNKDKTDLLKVAKKILETNGNIVIEGHTDNIGSYKRNMLLSKRRAESVKRFFIENKIDIEKIKIEAYGESNPVSTNATKEGRQKNRRVEVIIFPQNNNTKDVTGVWKSKSLGELHIYRYGDIIAGWYSKYGGEIRGKLIDDHTIEGVWAENSSKRKCKKDLYGRNYIGKFRINFNKDFSQITGTWGYCDDEPNRKGYTGYRKK